MAIEKAGINKNPNGGVLPSRGVFRTTFTAAEVPGYFHWSASNRQNSPTAISETPVDGGDYTRTETETTTTTKSYDITEVNGPSTIFNSAGAESYVGGLLTFPDDRRENTATVEIGNIANSETKVLQTPFSVSSSLGPITVKPESLAIASQEALDESGEVAIYSSTGPYVRETGTILPGINLTCVPVGGRGILVSPDTVLRAWHNRGSTTGTYTFVDNTNTVHTVSGSLFSAQLGGDLVFHKLANPLPSTVSPALIPPSDFEDYFSMDVNEVKEAMRGFRVEYTEGHRLTVGYVNLLTANFDINESSDLPSGLWSEAISGDSGGAMFMVIDGQIVALAGTWNTAEAGTSVIS